MRRYRRRPPVVEAIQWTGSNTAEVILWSRGRLVDRVDGRPVIATSDAMSWAGVGDYLVREPVPGGGHRYYGARRETFEHSYEPIPPSA